jgi:hypothetical protein
VLELGAGVGVVGIIAAKCGAECVCTAAPFPSLMLLSLSLIFFCLVCARNQFSVFVRNSDSAAAAVSGCVCLAIHVKVISEYPLNLPYASHLMMIACMHIHSHTSTERLR